MRFYLWRTDNLNMYTNYALIEPTLLTKGNLDTRPKTTYQNTNGLGIFFGRKRAYNAELRIMHSSNGNIFPQNSGVAVPVQFTLGKTF